MNKFYTYLQPKPYLLLFFLLVTAFSFSQDLIMQNGNFNRCAPDSFFDSGGATGNYSSNENFTVTICPSTPGEVLILRFTEFNTQIGSDILTIYDGDSTASPVIGNFSGTVSPGTVASTHPSGCLTVSFSSSAFGNTTGWAANIICSQPCQTITASIDSTTPAINTATNQIEILPGQTVDFIGSATFSDSSANATYLWNFGTGGTATTTSTSHQFDTPGTYNVTFTASDNSPLGCSDTQTITVFVTDSIVTINNTAFPQSFLPPDQLIEEVLVTGGCSAVDNFETQVFGGPADTTTKSYGFFSRGGAIGFPFEEGIVITSGNAFNGGNNVIPTTLTGQNGLSGDTDLEDNLGITNTQDATFIKFDFTPTADNISFRYLLASEEYTMGDECNFADGFAFLLRVAGSGDPYQNLAVLPDGTPVNVTNINGIACPTSPVNNPAFFEGYNIGDTNYNGRTVVLTATAPVVANTTYEIKLVVADQGDDLFDTAIFIEAGSFNLGGELGDDITLANGNAVCGGGLEDITLDTQAPSATHTWFVDGVEIPGETGSTLTIQDPGFYEVTVNFGGTCEVMDSITVEFRNSPEIVAPAIDLAGCSPTGIAEFNLEQNTPIVFGAQSDTEFAVTYHNSLTDAQTGDNPIPDINNYSGSDGEVIFIRIDDIATENCVVTDDFVLSVFASVTAEDVEFNLCDNADDGDDANGFVEFQLDTIDADVLDAQDPTQFSVSYHISSTDAINGDNPLPNLYTNTTANTQIIFARVQNNSNIDCFETSEITLQVNVLPIANTVQNQLICDDNNDGFWAFDLDALQPQVLGGQVASQYNITFHSSLVDAQTDTGAIVSLYTNQVAYQEETIYARIENVDNEDCFDTTDFIIDVFEQPTATTYLYELCDDDADGDDTNGFVEFDLPTIDLNILNGQDPTQFTVSYHFDQVNADAGTNPLPNLYTNAIANNDQIIARVQNNDNPDCFATVVVDLEVEALPVITSNVELRQCDTDTDGISSFNLTEANVLISTNSANETFSYYLNLADANAANNPIVNETTYDNTDASAAPDLLFVRVENADGCHRVAQLELFVATSQIPPGFAIAPYEECDDTRVDDNITDGISTFDFSDATAQIVGVFPIGQNISVTYYESTADALAEQYAIPDIANHINSASPFTQTITFRVDNDDDNSCQGIGEFELRTINPTPRTDTESVDLVLCDDITIGDLSEEFDLTQNEAFIFDGIPDLDATYFLDYDDALNNVTANQILNPTTYNNTNTNETIYVRVVDTNTGCFAIVDFDITVNSLPEVVPVTPIEECENGTDGVFTFNIGEKRPEILNGQDPNQFIVTFHLSQADADNITNPQPDSIENTISNPQEIFFAITNNVTGCSNSTGSFFIEVFEGAQANSDGEPLDFELCDDNIENDGIAQFDLNTLQDEVLDGQDPDDYTITYHFTETDAINDENPLPFLYENLTNPQTIWVRVSNNISPDLCFEVQPVPLIVNPIPDFQIDDLYVLCTSINGSEVVPVPPIIDTGLSPADYSFTWSLDDVILPSETGPSLIPNTGGVYKVTATDISTSTITNCERTEETTVLESQVPNVIAQVTSQAFSGNHTIEVTTTNSGDFEFSLDNGPYQDSNIFENVTGGTHTVYARDINGCGVGSDTVIVIDYPHFFTPNGDGRHDTWNILGIDTQPSAKIYIFDRYGKLLKQLSPTDQGWDGTYQGNRMPTDDYWFVLEYIEPTTGESKQQRAHFTLKR